MPIKVPPKVTAFKKASLKPVVKPAAQPVGVTAPAREAIRARAKAAGKTSITTKNINATFAKNKARSQATAVAAAKAAGASPSTVAPGQNMTNGLDPTSAAFKSAYGIPRDIRTVGDLTMPENITDAQRAEAQSQNMSLTNWHKYQIAKVQAARSGQILGESKDFMAAHTAADYLKNTLNNGDIRMYAAGDQRDIAARAEALKEMGLTEADLAPAKAKPAKPAKAKAKAKAKK